MNWLMKAKQIFVRAAEIRKNRLDLSLDEQWAKIARHIEQENATERQRLENLYPAGWFKLTGNRGSQELAHYCPKCKQLSTGKVAVHCSGRKRENRPEGWRLIFLKPAPARF